MIQKIRNAFIRYLRKKLAIKPPGLSNNETIEIWNHFPFVQDPPLIYPDTFKKRDHNYSSYSFYDFKIYAKTLDGKIGSLAEVQSWKEEIGPTFSGRFELEVILFDRFPLKEIYSKIETIFIIAANEYGHVCVHSLDVKYHSYISKVNIDNLVQPITMYFTVDNVSDWINKEHLPPLTEEEKEKLINMSVNEQIKFKIERLFNV